ncbi:hypothetical protein BAE44_0021051, partial [Dichanthelium oligosanthes]
MPGSATAGAPTIASLAVSNPSISFHLLQPPRYPDPDHNPFVRKLDALRLSEPSLLALLRSLPSVAVLIVDVFCAHAVTSPPSSASLRTSTTARPPTHWLRPSTCHTSTPRRPPDMGKALLRFPDLPPIPALDMPFSVQDRERRSFKPRGALYARVAEASGVLVNTFEWLEFRAVKVLREGACAPGSPLPPLYCVGQLLAAASSGQAARSERHPCLTWLDAQPDRSVVPLLRRRGRLLGGTAEG